jgi:hypothetical protein
MGRTPDHVYVISSECGRVKIGISSSPPNRFMGLSGSSPRKLTLEHVEVANDFEGFAERIEGWCHKVLADHRSHGEWFNVPVEEAIKTVRQVTVYARNTRPLRICDQVLDVVAGGPSSRYCMKLIWKNGDGSETLLTFMRIASAEALIKKLQHVIDEIKYRPCEELDPFIAKTLGAVS